jgi:hypothetical protein
MVLGHFAVAVAAKPRAPEVPVWALMVASQAMEIAFLPMVALGLEGITMAGYGQSTINAHYTHSLVGALIIAAVMFAIGKAVWKTQRAAWTLGLLSASHWVLDLVVHRQDMPILPGNIGNLPLLGLGLWNYPWIALAIEIVLGLTGLLIYFRWARQKSQRDPRWYWGPAITAVIFVALVLSDLPASPLA